ncbi:hypothetical protein HER32_16545 [Hymenobacter sp. BT18]|uniref:hypothetical protein n=1 Tax=Hymenobacter sp. BT18 TaxID=2835648 RepID=UPI00143E6C08|nr:hypothetical protein [Hymenobacter sp. BT18]QIX62692.1 hypothetical protein HER32_16545 [Hymenobacter sp. BT18]
MTALLGKTPTPKKTSKFSLNNYDLWHYQVDTSDEEEPFDFVNTFLDILEGKYDALVDLGIQRKDIIFWLVYEYDQQCAIEFHPQEMMRLGVNGIHLNVDCYRVSANLVQ